jgi:large subunit ribosomal protein L23
MAITDIFKKEEAQKGKKKPGAKPAAEKTDKKEARRPKNAGRAMRVLAGVHATEKAANMAEGERYVFKVAKTAGKKEIARAVEDYYGVDVVSVNVINIPGRNRRNRRGIYFESGYRKAAVKIKKGQTIEAAATK